MIHIHRSLTEYSLLFYKYTESVAFLWCKSHEDMYSWRLGDCHLLHVATFATSCHSGKMQLQCLCRDIPGHIPLAVGGGAFRPFDQLLSLKQSSHKTLWPTLLQHCRLLTNFLAVSKTLGGVTPPFPQKTHRCAFAPHKYIRILFISFLCLFVSDPS